MLSETLMDEADEIAREQADEAAKEAADEAAKEDADGPYDEAYQEAYDKAFKEAEPKKRASLRRSLYIFGRGRRRAQAAAKSSRLIEGLLPSADAARSTVSSMTRALSGSRKLSS
jgi:flagellar biosynthesis/type III secretory pathway protein FliH